MASRRLPAADSIKIIEAPQHPNRQRFDPFTLNEIMDRFGVPGVSISVIKDFEIHWAKGYGNADVVTGAKVNTDTLFQAASISKPVNAMALLKVAQDGKLSIDDDINTILKSWKLPKSSFTEGQCVTARALASHTSGLGDGFGFPGYNPSDPLPTTIQILNGDKRSNVGPVLLARPPMTASHYSGGGVTILQLALTDVIGRSYPEILQEYVLEPIGMTQSTFEQPLSPERDKNATRAHDGEGQAMGVKWHVYPELAAAGLWTTPTDLAKFAIEVQKSLRGEANNVLSQTMIKAMLSPVGVGDYAVGFSVAKEGEGWYFSHGGGNWGFRCVLAAHKVKGYGFAIMTNAENGGIILDELKERIERAYGYDSLDKFVAR
jgi:CubicO group peptidase (beta-lactamase class C family)